MPHKAPEASTSHAVCAGPAPNTSSLIALAVRGLPADAISSRFYSSVRRAALRAELQLKAVLHGKKVGSRGLPSWAHLRSAPAPAFQAAGIAALLDASASTVLVDLESEGGRPSNPLLAALLESEPALAEVRLITVGHSRCEPRLTRAWPRVRCVRGGTADGWAALAALLDSMPSSTRAVVWSARTKRRQRPDAALSHPRLAMAVAPPPADDATYPPGSLLVDGGHLHLGRRALRLMA